MFQVFISHSKYDEEFCNAFDSACASVGLKRFRSEFENIEKPAWKTIKGEIKKSNALFLLVGKELAKRQSSCLVNSPENTDWLFTQNWISYEIGVASQRGIDVWVLCDPIDINFPVPYLNCYDPWGIHLKHPESRNFILTILNAYQNARRVEFDKRFIFKCADCGAAYNIFSRLEKEFKLRCPTCLKMQTFPNGWLLDTKEDSSFLKNVISKIYRKRQA
jgi:ribosomal protein S27E